MINLLKRTYLTVVFLFLYAPIAVLIVLSFNESKSRSNWTGFSLKWYKELFKDPNIMRALYYTVIIALLSAVIATIIGTIAAVGIDSMNKVSKTVILNITNLPILNPDIVTGVALMILYIFFFSILKAGSLGFTTLLLSHIAFNIPYVILSVLPRLRRMDNNLYEAALDLGATPFFAFTRVIIPEIFPGIISGALLAFTLSIDDFVISFFTTGKGVSNLSILIYSMARRGINPKINALSTIMFLCVLLMLYLVNKMDKSGDPQKFIKEE